MMPCLRGVEWSPLTVLFSITRALVACKLHLQCRVLLPRHLVTSSHFHSTATSKGALGAVHDIEESVNILVLVIDRTHKSCRGGHRVLDKDEYGLFGTQLNTLPNDVPAAPKDTRTTKIHPCYKNTDPNGAYLHKLSDGEICRDQILFLVNVRNVRLVVPLTDHGNSLWVLGSNTRSLPASTLQ